MPSFKTYSQHISIQASNIFAQAPPLILSRKEKVRKLLILIVVHLSKRSKDPRLLGAYSSLDLRMMARYQPTVSLPLMASPVHLL